MRLAERVLLSLSRSPAASDRPAGVNSWEGRDPLELLHAAFPELLQWINGADILDFGCGCGHQSIALAAKGAKSVMGVDIVSANVAEARCLSGGATNVAFAETVPDQASFDIIVSQNSMEHFEDPLQILRLWRRSLRPGGFVLVTFGPPWLSPYGAHMHFFTAVPWVHLVFSERTVMSARSKFRDDGAMHYHEVPGGLAKLTVGRFEHLATQAGFRISMARRSTVKGVPGASIPVLRELIINNVSVRLQS